MAEQQVKPGKRSEAQTPGKGPRKGGSYIKDAKTGVETLKHRTAPAPTAAEKAKAAEKVKEEVSHV